MDLRPFKPVDTFGILKQGDCHMRMSQTRCVSKISSPSGALGILEGLQGGAVVVSGGWE